MIESITGIGRINVGNLRRMENKSQAISKNFVKPLKYVCLTHNDLDACGCVAVLEETLKPIKYFYTNKKVSVIMEDRIKDNTIDVIDIDHDAGEYAQLGGDYIKLLDWLEETGRNYPIHIHSMNPVGVENMRRIIKRNGWIEV